MKKRIIAQIPPHKTYVEPFVGGGSVFFEKPLAEKNVINDLDKDLINFYKNIKKNSCGLAKSCKVPTNKKQFDKLNTKTACGYFGKIKSSYGCDKSGGFGYRNHDKKTTFKKNCNELQDKLKKTQILNEDFEKVLKKHNKKDTFAYLDPPYVDHEYLYKETKKNVRPERVCESLKNFKGKFLMSFDDHPDVRKACKDFKIRKIDHKYSITEPKKIKELLIRNY